MVPPRSRSTRRVRQEEEAAAVSREASPPRHLATSLLSLPDDTLLQILDELYQDQYGDNIVAAPVAEILINKRIFNLAFPLWVSRLSIGESQLDLRLSKLLVHSQRRRNLRRLRLNFQPNHAHLAGAAISRSPRLTHLHLTVGESFPEDSIDALLSGIEEARSLYHFNMHFNNDLSLRMSFVRKCWVELQAENTIYEEHIDGKFRTKLERTREHESRGYGTLGPHSYSHVPWPSIHSFEIIHQNANSPPVSDLLSSLRYNVENDDTEIEHIPLKRFALQFCFASLQDRVSDRNFNPKNFTELIRLLTYTQLERLEFSSVNWIPRLLDVHSVPSLKLLRLSGSCRFDEEGNFESLSPLLDSFPSLTQLHLVGSSFFKKNSTAQEISRLSPKQISYTYPLLAALLGILRNSKIQIFTYCDNEDSYTKGRREMRWYRSKDSEDFVSDCWTL